MLETLKEFLGIQASDSSKDSLLTSILGMVGTQLAALIGVQADKLPAESEGIQIEVAIARYNRIGSEGLSSHTVEGETMTWTNDDFAPFEAQIRLLKKKYGNYGEGKVRFI